MLIYLLGQNLFIYGYIIIMLVVLSPEDFNCNEKHQHWRLFL